MRAVVLFLLLTLLISFEGRAQVSEEDLIGTWLPLGVRHGNDGSYIYQVNALFTFKKNGAGIKRDMIGASSGFNFRYKFRF